jgi:putative ABC transport system ATP-binding protein
MSDEPLVHGRGLVKTFERGRVRAVDGVDLDIREGEFVAIVGPSGCGKSTLLNLIAALDRADEGELTVAGHRLTGGRHLDHFRAHDVGLVFQLDNLVPSLTALENIEVAMIGTVRSRKERRERAAEQLRFVAMLSRGGSRPPQLSGGERQRVAIARALVNRPPLVLADEPTGRLDSHTGDVVLNLLRTLQEEQGVTVVVVSHDPRVTAVADRVLHMLDGRVREEALR